MNALNNQEQRGAGTFGTASPFAPPMKGNHMSKKQPPNHGKAWKPAEVKKLEKLAEQNTPTRVMGLKLGRTPEAIQQKASGEGISLKPTNQSPYNRRKD